VCFVFDIALQIKRGPRIQPAHFTSKSRRSYGMAVKTQRFAWWGPLKQRLKKMVR